MQNRRYRQPELPRLGCGTLALRFIRYRRRAATIAEELYDIIWHGICVPRTDHTGKGEIGRESVRRWRVGRSTCIGYILVEFTMLTAPKQLHPVFGGFLFALVTRKNKREGRGRGRGIRVQTMQALL